MVRRSSLTRRHVMYEVIIVKPTRTVVEEFAIHLLQRWFMDFVIDGVLGRFIHPSREQRWGDLDFHTYLIRCYPNNIRSLELEFWKL